MSDKWSKWFTSASIIHGVGVAIWSGLFLLDGIGIPLNLSRIIAGGGVGTWFTVGYFLYLIIGFVGMAVQGTIFYLLPKLTHRELYSDKLALAHFALMNIAVMGTTWMLGLAGFHGGSLALAGKTTGEIHNAIVMYVEPIGYCILIGVVSVFLFVINLIMTLFKK